MVRWDWQIRVDPGEYSKQMGVELARLRQKAGWEEMLGEAAAELERVMRPAVCWERYPVQEIRHGRVMLENGLRLGKGFTTEKVMGGADTLIVAVLTLGDGPDRAVQNAQQQGAYLKAMLLHDLAATVVETLRQQFCHQLEIEARQAGRYTSATLSPGESSWPIEEQAVIFSLVDAEQIGVTLTESLVMVPVKSLSLVIGEGQQEMGEGDAEPCGYCTIQERCRYRQLRVTPARFAGLLILPSG